MLELQVHVKVTGCEAQYCVCLAHNGDKCRAFVNSEMNLGFNKRGDLLEYLTYC